MARQPKRDFGDIIAPSGNGKLQTPTPEPNSENRHQRPPNPRNGAIRLVRGNARCNSSSLKTHTRSLRIVCAERKINNQVVLIEALNDWFQIERFTTDCLIFG